MALIKCPECGGKLSDSVKQCIHCNAKITKCPECGIVFSEDSINCPECGFSFKNDINENDDYIEYHETLNEESTEEPIAETSNNNKKNTSEVIVDRWMRETPIRKIYTGSATTAICLIIYIALIILIGVNYTEWQQLRIVNGDPLVEAESYLNLVGSADDVFSKIRTYILIFIIVLIIDSICGKLRKYLSIKDYWNWTISKSLNLRSVVNNDFSLDFDSMSEIGKKYTNFSLETHMYDDNIEIRKIYTAKGILCTLSEIILCLSFGFLWIQYSEYTMKMVINDFAFDGIEKMIDNLLVFASEHWFAVSILIAFSIIEWILNRYFDNKLEKIRINWITLNIPEGKEIYQNYLKKNKLF